MNDLISRSALLEKATNVTKYDEGGWGMDLKAVPIEDVLKAPAVDAVEVVRCKDCKYYESTHYGHMCKCWEAWLPTTVYFIREDDDFCSYGERRADDGRNK